MKGLNKFHNKLFWNNFRMNYSPIHKYTAMIPQEILNDFKYYDVTVTSYDDINSLISAYRLYLNNYHGPNSLIVDSNKLLDSMINCNHYDNDITYSRNYGYWQSFINGVNSIRNDSMKHSATYSRDISFGICTGIQDNDDLDECFDEGLIPETEFILMYIQEISEYNIKKYHNRVIASSAPDTSNTYYLIKGKYGVSDQ